MYNVFLAINDNIWLCVQTFHARNDGQKRKGRIITKKFRGGHGQSVKKLDEEGWVAMNVVPMRMDSIGLVEDVKA